MPITLRSRPTCHYCGKKNKPFSGRQFQCHDCLAENFVDEDGEITDVPAEASTTPKQFAQPTASFESTSIFCATCLKNQALYTAALSEFLPDPEDPEYDRFEDALPGFKTRMEAQYPQCCSRCEPKVRERLQQATYNARTDHLRRVLVKSRAKRVANRFGWRSLLVFLSGILWFTNSLYQLLWHALGSQSAMVSQPLEQLSQCLNTWPVPYNCSEAIGQYVWVSLSLGLLCIWWNPRWQSRLQGQAGRLVGLSTYYKYQAVILVLRFIVWISVTDIQDLAPYQRQLHSTFLVLFSLLYVYSSTIVKVDNNPLVDWHQEPTSLVIQDQFEPPPLTLPSSSEEKVSIDSFKSSSRPTFQPWQLPTPSNDADADAMDWTPSPSAFTPQPKTITYKNSQPTPFRGTLPQLPQSNVFANREPEKAKSIGIPIGFFDKPRNKDHKMMETKAPMAEPKFFPTDARADTGLENIFGKVFSLHEDAIELRHGEKATRDIPTLSLSKILKHDARFFWLALRMLDATCITLLTLLTLYCMLSSFLEHIDEEQITYATYFAATISTIEAISSLAQEAIGAGFFLRIFVLGQTLALAVIQPEKRSLLSPLWNKLLVGDLCILLIHEAYSFCTRDPTTLRTPDLSNSVGPMSGHIRDQVSSSRRDSLSSIMSTTSVDTTSTASGWKTPVVDHRLELTDFFSRTGRNNNGLATGNSGVSNFSVGQSVAGPRPRRR